MDKLLEEVRDSLLDHSQSLRDAGASLDESKIGSLSDLVTIDSTASHTRVGQANVTAISATGSGKFRRSQQQQLRLLWVKTPLLGSLRRIFAVLRFTLA
jgi:hypothetical protein